jgi:catechol 2,3-dioxygenase-like lactoylglutathione lyase family enzyme
MSTVVPLSAPPEVRTPKDAQPAPSVGTRFHLSLNVSNIERVAAFLQLVLGVAPAKQRTDYAKFELDSPPLVLSLEPNPPRETGSLNHVGFRFANTKDLLSVQQRIEAAGISTQREEGVECCYAKQTKFWVHDPDQRLWEFYVLEGDLDHRGGGQTMEQMVGETASCSIKTAQLLPVVWEHRMGSEFSLPAELCDEIRLRGTFNVPTTSREVQHIVAQVYQHLKPGGQVELHMLTTEVPVTGTLELPGPAAHVKHVPVRTELMNALSTAGFRDLQLTTFRSGACFQSHGIPLRETKIVAWKPLEQSPASERKTTLIYRGPFAEIKDDQGLTWHRGEPISIPIARWNELQKASMASMFTEMPDTEVSGQCGR